LIKFGQVFYARGWNLATSSNFSAVINSEPLQLLMTASGKHKGELTLGDFVIVDEALRKVQSPTFATAENSKPSAEASLHVALAKRLNVK
ncbi:class II aldolase/adducin family protein, partial [Acinetobacter baumannii]